MILSSVLQILLLLKQRFGLLVDLIQAFELGFVVLELVPQEALPDHVVGVFKKLGLLVVSVSDVLQLDLEDVLHTFADALADFDNLLSARCSFEILVFDGLFFDFAEAIQLSDHELIVDQLVLEPGVFSVKRSDKAGWVVQHIEVALERRDNFKSEAVDSEQRRLVADVYFVDLAVLERVQARLLCFVDYKLH